MISLFLNTFSSYLDIGLLEDKKVLKEIYLPLEKNLSRDTHVYLEKLLLECNKKPSEIDRIYCVVGPGSFTGVRIGVTIAKTYAYALKKEVYPVSSLFVMATSKKDADYIIPIIDARRGYVFAGIYNKKYQPILEDQYISLTCLKEEVKKLAGKKVYISLDSFEELETEPYHPNLVNFINEVKAEPIDPHQLVPNYLKKTEAEENLNK